MSPSTGSQVAAETNEEMIAAAIEKAREDLKPISRRMLGLMLNQKRNLPYKEAIEIVDAYCDEKAPYIPGYVSSEFGIYWLKVIAVFNVLIGVTVAYFGVRAYQDPKQIAWPWFCVATIFIGLAALSWVKSVEREFGKRD